MQLVFSAEGKAWPIQLNGDALRTRRSLLAALPLRLQLHTPKIAGSHIYWHAPFVEDVEGATHVLDAKAGAFIYWPVRQFLEITFAPLQAETAEITVLGHLDAPVEGIAELAAVLKREQGRRVIDGTLALADGGSVEAWPASTLAHDIVAGRKVIWDRMPDDIARITASRAIMHPAGPVFTAEAEARVLHELLWWIRSERGSVNEAVLRQTAALALNKAATRLRDFCHLEETPSLLFRLERAMGEQAPFDALIDEAILVAGRIGAWLDLLIPWNDLNEAFRAALDGRRA
ncbi:hypothetical protein RFM41_15775 [Mesorhizobium sp. VK25A]|uniref:Uncharacterized protein n=1 Tax=Mesorhizobium vachelliae TaxID=3072309 RepID=A0ABU5A7X6_9HYPH|nr:MULTISPECIES: hypothetical protein [unclassified Mesorhizobium]MDX8533290.1 hypothetical protein [Mesorhizobium sp. VK25D]MDX8545209.1 hypothetical protein [Mesorhizobium sp. VK25A]